MKCAVHGDELAWEEGGPDKPTVLGRWRCDACDVVFMDIMRRTDGDDS